MNRIGIGIDVHRYVEEREFWLGCVLIPYELGLDGHSDADALVHAITDAILGALGRRDIGFFYPPGDPTWKGYPGRKFLGDMRALLEEEGWVLENLDSVIVAEQPKLSAHIPAMREAIARHLGVDENRIGIKATTSERMGFVGRGEGVFVQAVVLLKQNTESVG